ncbi:hypothetical protein Ahy_A05g022415 isoform D [Arachis hypogaea]|uniref:Uncharacterized protein n=1 Tax=Arachis hypogaea TaxID=3818 RepID=A0A445D0N6_ARAHY|nr:hypothetical protein Ahy_A05g022415 isoform D [Arachis hypogaea]
MEAPASAPHKERRSNESVFDGAIGIGCSNLGIPMTNSSTTTPPPTLSASGKNEAKVNALW